MRLLNLYDLSRRAFLDANPMPTSPIASAFNDLRQDLVLLHELKLALANCEYELQTLRHRHDTLIPGQVRTVTYRNDDTQ